MASALPLPTMGDTTVTLAVEGALHRGWETVTLKRSIETFAGEFDVSLTDRWADADAPARQIKTGAAVKVTVGASAEPVISGWIDAVSQHYDEKTREITITGRDRTGDLVDCSAFHPGGHWTNAKLELIVWDLVKPFKINVRSEVDTGAPLPRFAIQQGETVHSAIDRACKQRAVLAVSDGRGAIVLTRAGKKTSATLLRLGGTIEAAQAEFDDRERFSDYIAKGQQGFNRAGSAKAAVTPKAIARDEEITRYRPMILRGETESASGDLQKRVEWERNVRAGRSRKVTYTVPGWHQTPGGPLWDINLLVPVSDSFLHLDETLLIAGLTFRQGVESGTVTELEVVRKEAFDVPPPKALKKARKGRTGKNELW